MYPLTRTVKTVAMAALRDRLEVTAQSETSFICRPWDIDPFGELNNGRALTLYDLGRFDFIIRTGVAKMMREQRWGLVVAGATVQYRKRVRMFSHVTLRTRIAAMDDRWIYITQSMWVKDKPASSILLRTGLTERGKVIETARSTEIFGLERWDSTLEPWMLKWVASEADREWPPT